MPDIAYILAVLVEERDRLNSAIEALQGPVKRRGRPPKSDGAVRPAGKRRVRSAAERKAQSERMRKYWAARKRQDKAKRQG